MAVQLGGEVGRGVVKGLAFRRKKLFWDFFLFFEKVPTVKFYFFFLGGASLCVMLLFSVPKWYIHNGFQEHYADRQISQ